MPLDFSRTIGPQARRVRQSERRRYPRHARNDPAEVCLVPIDGTSWQATVSDISSAGLGIELGAPLRRGSRIEVVSAKQVIFGEVRHCRKIGKIFRAGIVVEAVFYSKPLRKVTVGRS